MTEIKIAVFGIRHCYLVYNNASAFGFKRAWYNKESEIKVDNGKLEFAGDGQKFTRAYGYQASGTIAADVDDDTLSTILWSISKVSPSGGDGFASAEYHGTDQEMQANYLAVWLTLDAENYDTGAPLAVRYNIFKVLFDPEAPPKYASETNAGRMLSFNAYRTTTDILGNTPTGMPARGAFWRRELITNTTNFDPVPGDVA